MEKTVAPELMKSLLSKEEYQEWERREQTRREFWRTLQGPAQRPLGANADEWNLFVSENKDATAYLAVQIAEALEEAWRRGAAGEAINPTETFWQAAERLGCCHYPRMCETCPMRDFHGRHSKSGSGNG